MIVQEKFDAE